MTNRLIHSYHLDESVVIGSNFSFLFHFSMKIMCAKRIAQDGTPRCVALHLGLFCFFMSHEKGFRLDQLRKIIMRYKRTGYNLNVMRESACLVTNPITVDGALFNCTPVDRVSDSMMAPTLSYSF